MLREQVDAEIRRDRIEPAAVDDACPRLPGAGVVAIDRVADEVHLAGQIAIIGALLGAGGGEFAPVHRVGPDGGANDARVLRQEIEQLANVIGFEPIAMQQDDLLGLISDQLS